MPSACRMAGGTSPSGNTTFAGLVGDDTRDLAALSAGDPAADAGRGVRQHHGRPDLAQQHGERVRLDLLVLRRIELGRLHAVKLIERTRVPWSGTARPDTTSAAPHRAAIVRDARS